MQITRSQFVALPSAEPEAPESISPLSAGHIEVTQLAAPGAPIQKLLVSADARWKAGDYVGALAAFEAHVAPYSVEGIATLDLSGVLTAYSNLAIIQQRLVALSNKLTVKDGTAGLRALELSRNVSAFKGAVFTRLAQISDSRAEEPVSAWQLLRTTMKQPGHSAAADRDAYYINKIREFIRAGGSLEQVAAVDASFFAQLKSGELCEFVVDANDTPRICRSDVKPAPNHTLLSRGNDALTAGSLRVFKNDSGELTQVVLGTYSGHFRPPLHTLQHMVRHLMAAGVPKEKIVIEAGEAGTARPIDDILFKLAGVDGAAAQNYMAQLEAESYRWSPQNVQSTEIVGNPLLGDDPLKSLATKNLNEAEFIMRESIGAAMADGLLLESMGEVEKTTSAIERVLTLAQEAGDPVRYRQALATLKHLASFDAPHIDALGKTALTKVFQRWENHEFGTGVFDAADVMGPRPVGRRARLLGNIDPKGSTVASISELLMAGLNVGRLNAAHGTLEDHERTIGFIRQAAIETGREVAVLLDVPGPKIRLGKFENPKGLEYNDVYLKKGEKVTFTTADVLGDNEGEGKVIPVDYGAMAQDVKPGHVIFLNDGTVKCVATKAFVDAQGNGVVEAEVLNDGKVWDRKGINLPDSDISIPTVTEFDKSVIRRLGKSVDMLGVSFVRRAEDIYVAKALMAQIGNPVPIIAKLERREAMQNLESIMNATDVAMVARGDLGQEIGMENVPAAERRINMVGNMMGKPTVVATEVFDSMKKQGARPSRAEVEAVYAAIHDHGSDGLLLTGEISSGKYPAEALRSADVIIKAAEEIPKAALLKSVSPGQREFRPGRVMDVMLRQVNNQLSAGEKSLIGERAEQG